MAQERAPRYLGKGFYALPADTPERLWPHDGSVVMHRRTFFKWKIWAVRYPHAVHLCRRWVPTGAPTELPWWKDGVPPILEGAGRGPVFVRTFSAERLTATLEPIQLPLDTMVGARRGLFDWAEDVVAGRR